MPGTGIASYKTAILGFLHQNLAGICNSVWVWWLETLKFIEEKVGKTKPPAMSDSWVDTSFLLRIWNKIPIKGVIETKFGAKTKGWTIQRIPHPGIHPIISHQTQTLLHMPERFC